MSTNLPPPGQNETDAAIHALLEYLTLSDIVEGELNAVNPAIWRVILALLVAEEAAGGLTPYRRSLLDQLRASPPPVGTAGGFGSPKEDR
jgi:hypothetical protein